jgi:hypothetical protein
LEAVHPLIRQVGKEPFATVVLHPSRTDRAASIAPSIAPSAEERQDTGLKPFGELNPVHAGLRCHLSRVWSKLYLAVVFVGSYGPLAFSRFAMERAHRHNPRPFLANPRIVADIRTVRGNLDPSILKRIHSNCADILHMSACFR